jgi:hypothetical protein
MMADLVAGDNAYALVRSQKGGLDCHDIAMT